MSQDETTKPERKPTMNPNTGAIAQFENTLDAALAGHTVSLTDDQAKLLGGMNRAERRKWLRENAGDEIARLSARCDELAEENRDLREQNERLRKATP